MTTKKDFDQDLSLVSGQNIFSFFIVFFNYMNFFIMKNEWTEIHYFVHAHTKSLYMIFYSVALKKLKAELASSRIMTYDKDYTLLQLYMYKTIVWRSLNIKEYQPST